MSLKALVQLFAEKFLVSKKEWVGHQAFPHHRVSVDNTVKSYIAPSDGWISVRAASTAFDSFAGATATSGIVARFSCYAVSSAATTATLPISKGQTFTINFTGGVQEIWFSPANGSTT